MPDGTQMTQISEISAGSRHGGGAESVGVRPETLRSAQISSICVVRVPVDPCFIRTRDAQSRPRAATEDSNRGIRGSPSAAQPQPIRRNREFCESRKGRTANERECTLMVHLRRGPPFQGGVRSVPILPGCARVARDSGLAVDPLRATGSTIEKSVGSLERPVSRTYRRFLLRGSRRICARRANSSRY
jgi:hypothetical protein